MKYPDTVDTIGERDFRNERRIFGAGSFLGFGSFRNCRIFCMNERKGCFEDTGKFKTGANHD